MGRLQLETENSIHSVGTLDNTLLVVWRDTPTLEAFKRVNAAAARLAERCPDGIGTFGVAPANMPLLGSAERKEASALLERFGGQLRAVASVIEGTGFAASATRSVMTAISVLARSPCPLKIFGSFDEGVDWYTARVDIPPPALRQAIERMRQIA
jgi:hypothetical protein